MVILETERLYLREIQADDYADICLFLQDIDVMYAWEHAFSDEEVVDWINKNIIRYQQDGYSYWAVIDKAAKRLIGASGILREAAGDEDCIGVGYIFNKDYWRKGYALEAASACVRYAFDILHVKEITAQIRPENITSRKIAEKLGMSIKKQFVRRDNGKDMPHLLYSRTK